MVWVLTGDKPETAINIAYSAKLFSPQMDLLKLMARSKDAAQNTIYNYLADIERSLNEEMTATQSSSSSIDYDYTRSSQRNKTRALAVDGKDIFFILLWTNNIFYLGKKINTFLH